MQSHGSWRVSGSKTPLLLPLPTIQDRYAYMDSCLAVFVGNLGEQQVAGDAQQAARREFLSACRE